MQRTLGLETKGKILRRGVQLASVHGLSAMSLSTLAAATDMSKSGLFSHFKSKEALQIAILDEAEAMFRAAVVTPALARPAGILRLRDLLHRYVDYSAGALFDGGCFMSEVAHEWDGKPGPVHDRVITFVHNWKETIVAFTAETVAAGHIAPHVDGLRFAFAVIGFGLSTNWHAQLYCDAQAARTLGDDQMRSLFLHLATPAAHVLLQSEPEVQLDAPRAVLPRAG